MTPGEILGEHFPRKINLPQIDMSQIVSQQDLNKNITDRLDQIEAAIKDKNWVERHPVRFAIGMSVISALIAAIISQIEHIKWVSK